MKGASEKLKVIKTGGVEKAAGNKNVATLHPASGTVTVFSNDTEFSRRSKRRRRRMFGFHSLSFLALVVIPVIVVAIYLSFYASNRYTSEFRVIVRSAEPSNAGFPALLGLTGVSQTNNNSQSVVQYLQSREPVDELAKSLSLKSLFTGERIDWWSRLKDDVTAEEFVKYWRKMVDAYYETSTGTIVVRVTAFKPDEFLRLANSSLQLSEALVNRLSERVREDTLSFSNNEVKVAEDRLRNVNDKLRKLRDKEKILDPRKSAESDLELASKLTGELSQLNATLTQQLASLSNNSPPVKVTRGRIDALRQELRLVNKNITSGGANDRALSTVIGDFDQLENEKVFAEKAYQSSMASLEAARMDSNRQQLYLATIVKPSLPEEPSFPKPIYSSLLVFFAALIAWVGMLLLANAVMEHD